MAKIKSAAPPSPPRTVAAGGVIERTLVRRWARRKASALRLGACRSAYVNGCLATLEELVQWLWDQPRRTAKPGGIGRQ
jgi:hypothetical protein